MIPSRPIIDRETLNEDERDIYDRACERFAEGPTWCSLQGREKMEGLKLKLQKEYAEHCVECWRKYKKGRRGRY
jgi:hypothetical protein